MKSKEELYEEMMTIAYQLEDRLSYDETAKGREWGEIVNAMQGFSPHDSEFEEINTDHIDENGVTFLDGYKINQDEGEVVGYFINGEVYYTNPEYRYDSLVQKTVEQLKQQK